MRLGRIGHLIDPFGGRGSLPPPPLVVGPTPDPWAALVEPDLSYPDPTQALVEDA